MSKLWEHDPFKAKSAILANAYSIIRDEKDIRDPNLLQNFLKINAGFVEMVVPEVYLKTIGWAFVVNADGRTSLKKLHSHPGSFDRYMLTTNKSVEDVVQNSYNNGLGKASSNVDQTEWEAITMASSAQPSTSGNEPVDSQYQQQTGTYERVDLQYQQQIGTYENAADSYTVNADPVTSLTTPTMSEIEQYMGDYPYTVAFDPAATESFIYDPFAGDQFDAFELSSMEDLTSEDWFKTFLNQ